MFKFNIDDSLTNIIRFIFYIFSGLLTTTVFLFIFALVVTLLDLDDFYNGVFAILSLIFGTFLSSYLYVGYTQNKGFLNGILIGFFVYFVIFLISVFLSNNGFSLTSLFHLVSSVLSGGIAGILRVNKKEKMKYIK